MAIAKVILNGDTLMDVTSNTVTAGSMLSGITATKNDGTKATGTISSKSSSDLTASGATVTAPAGYYSTAATKNVAAGSAFPPAVTITTNPTISMVSSTGVVTASYTGSSSITPTVNAGYISQGTAGTVSTTGTKTFQLTSKAAATYYPSTADQTIASQRWLVGNQTIKSVTTSNLTAENIAEGVVVKVGDSSNASRITQVTGTHSGGGDAEYYKGTIINTTLGNTANVTYNSTVYRAVGETFYYKAGDTLTCYLNGVGYYDNKIIVDGVSVKSTSDGQAASYNLILPARPIEITMNSSEDSIRQLIVSSPIIDIIENGTYEVGGYGYANVNVAPTYTATISGKGGVAYCRVNYNGTAYYNNNDSFTFSPGDTIELFARGGGSDDYSVTVIIDGEIIEHESHSDYHGTYTLSNYDVTIYLESSIALAYNNITINSPALSITNNGKHDVADYRYANVNVSTGAGFTADEIAMRTISGAISGSAPTIGSHAFYSCSNLTAASFPACTTIYSNAFYNCYNLTTVSFPVCTTINTHAFYNCRSLTTVSFPSCTIISVSAFAYCSNLTAASFPACTKISGSAFYNCYNLLSLYLLGSSVVTLSNTNAFLYSPISNNTTSTGGVYGSIFVPSSLYNSYITATNWSVYSARIVSM